MGAEGKLMIRVSRRSLVLMLGLGLTLGVSLVGNAQTQPQLGSDGRWVNGVTEPWMFPDSVAKDSIREAQLRWVRIEGEQRTASDNPWVGDYFVGGDTHGSYLRFAPQGGFVVFHVNKCEARVMGFSYGKVSLSAALIQMLPDKTEHGSAQHGHSSTSSLRYLPVTWHRVKYLVPEEEIADFADYVAGLGEFNDPSFSLVEYARFFSMAESERPATAGAEQAKTQPNQGKLLFIAPVVPPGYESFIKKPVDAKIISRGRSYIKHDPENDWWNTLTIPVTINVGAAHGLKEKLLLRVLRSVGFGGRDEFVRITRVGLRSARGVIERPVRKQPCVKFDPTDDCLDPDYEPVRIGWKLTTNPVKEDPPSDR